MTWTLGTGHCAHIGATLGLDLGAFSDATARARWDDRKRAHPRDRRRPRRLPGFGARTPRARRLRRRRRGRRRRRCADRGRTPGARGRAARHRPARHERLRRRRADLVAHDGRPRLEPQSRSGQQARARMRRGRLHRQGRADGAQRSRRSSRRRRELPRSDAHGRRPPAGARACRRARRRRCRRAAAAAARMARGTHAQRQPGWRQRAVHRAELRGGGDGRWRRIVPGPAASGERGRLAADGARPRLGSFRARRPLRQTTACSRAARRCRARARSLRSRSTPGRPSSRCSCSPF